MIVMPAIRRLLAEFGEDMRALGAPQMLTHCQNGINKVANFQFLGLRDSRFCFATKFLPADLKQTAGHFC